MDDSQLRLPEVDPAVVSRGLDRRFAWAIGLVAAWIYLATLCRTVYVGDAGDFCVAIATGGVPHPTGYPLYGLLGRLVMLVPVGEPAFRIGWLSALPAGAAAGLLFALGRQIGLGRLGSALATAAFALGYTAWSQATRVEVYGLHLLFVVGLLGAVVRYHETGATVQLRWVFAWLALGISHHLTIALIALPAVAWLVPRWWVSQGRFRELGLGASMVALGLASYGLLLFWTRADPLHAWGHPADLPSLWRHMSGAAYRGYLGMPWSPGAWDRSGTAWSLFLDNLPGPLAALVPLGMGIWWGTRHRAGRFFSVVAAVVILYNVSYRIPDIASYYLPVWLIGALAAAAGLEGASRRLFSAPTGMRLQGMAAAGAVICLVARNWASCDLSRTTWARDFAQHKLQSVTRDGVLVCQNDNDMMPIWYVQDVLGVRPDVVVLDRALCAGNYAFYEIDPSDWYARRLRKKGLPLDIRPAPDETERRRRADDGFILDLIRGPLSERQLFFTFAEGRPTHAGDRQNLQRWCREQGTLVPRGLVLHQVFGPMERIDLPALIAENAGIWTRIDIPSFRNTRTDQDLDPGFVRDHYACMLVNFGGLYEMAGRMQPAFTTYAAAAEVSPTYRPAREALNSLRGRLRRADRSFGG